MSFLSAIGPALSVVKIFMDLMPESPPEGAAVRVKIGNPGDDNPGMEGDISNVYSWDTSNNYQGKADGQSIDAPGGIADFTIDSSSPGSRADFIGVSADNNAVCIAWITVSQKDGTQGGAWTGDVGADCGEDWNYQNEKAGKLPDSDEDYIPKCTWLDADHTGSARIASLKFRVDAYGEKAEDTVNNGAACSSTAFGTDDAPINAAPGRKRSARKRSPGMANTLVVSKHKHQTAEELCSSSTSVGNDFVGSDNMFCDMETHTLHPLCTKKNVEGCVNIDEANGAKRLTRRSFAANRGGFKRAVDGSAKDYKKIAHWG